MLAATLAAAMALGAQAQPIGQTELQSRVETALAENELVALGAAVAAVGEAPIVAVAGQTAKEGDTTALPEHAWHIGSNTKALTALLYARLVEDGKAKWGATMPDLFPSLADSIDPAWNDITIEDLFAHQSGAGQVGALWLISRHNDSAQLTDQRLETARSRLTAPPKSEPGVFEYSNLNYIIAGAAIEQMLGMSWEDAMQAYVFGAESSNWAEGWGFGPPADIEGHKRGMFGGMKSVGHGPGADNPQALGPAGTAHAPLASHAKLLLKFVDNDSALMTDETREHLLMPWPDETADYAMGWGIREDADAGTLYLHNGSNTMWLSRVALVPEHGAVIIVNTNEFSDASMKATQTVLEDLIDVVASDAQQ